MLLDSLEVTVEQFASGSGWVLKPEGACKGDLCVPLDLSGGFDVLAAAERLGMAVVRDDDAGLWAIGPETLGGRVLAGAGAPDLVLDDLHGKAFHLASLRGQKVVIVSWAPY